MGIDVILHEHGFNLFLPKSLEQYRGDVLVWILVLLYPTHRILKAANLDNSFYTHIFCVGVKENIKTSYKYVFPY